MKNSYSKIYKSKIGNQNKQFNKFLQDKNIINLTKRIKMTVRDKLRSKVSHKNMKNNKSPGTDSFQIKFYQFFWRDI